MKSRVVIMALLCLLLIFTGAMAQADIPAAPVPKANLVYTGEPQALYSDPEDVGYYWFWDADGTGTPKWSKSIPTAVNAGTYSYGYFLEGVTSSEVKLESVISPKNVKLAWFPDDGTEQPGETNTIDMTFNGEQNRRPIAKTEDIVDADKGTCVISISGDARFKVSEGVGKATATFTDATCAKNYTITNSEQKFEIIPVTVDLTWEPLSFTYDGEEHVPTATYTDMLNRTQQANVSGAQTNANKESEKYTAIASSSNGNYTFSNPKMEFNISPVNILVVIAGDSVEVPYDGTEHTAGYTVKGIYTYGDADKDPEETDLYTEDDFGPIDGKIVGLKGTNADIYEENDIWDQHFENKKFNEDGSTNFAVSFAPVEGDEDSKNISLTINKADVTLTWEGDEDGKTEVIEMVFDGTKQRPNADIASGMIDADKETCILTIGGDQLFKVSEGEGTAEAGFEDTSCDDNYTITNSKHKFKIVPTEVEVTWENTEFPYDGDPHAPTAKYTTVLGKEVELVIDTKTDAGKYTAAAKPDNKNYVFKEGTDTCDFEITRAKLTVTPRDNQSKTYGEDDPVLKCKVNGVINGDKLKYSGELSREDNENVGTYPISLGTFALADDEANKNYDPEFEFVEGVLFEIKPLVAELSWKNDKFTYDSDEHIPTATVANLVEGDSCEVTVEGGQTNAGDWYAEATKLSNTNYVLPEEDELQHYFKISKATVTVTADRKTKVYGEKDPELTYKIDPAEPAPGFTGKLTREPGEVVSGYYILQGDLALDENSKNNFKLEFVQGEFWITKADTSVIEPPDGKEGLVYNGQAQDLLETLAVPEDKTAVVVYQISSAKTTGMPNAKDAGDYEIEYYIQADDNHEELHDPSWKLTVSIAKAPLTAVPNPDQSKVFGAKDPDVFYFRFDGRVNGEGNPEFTGGIARKEGENVGTYAYTAGDLALKPDGTLARNYTLAFDDQGVTFAITEAQARITAHPKAITLTYTGEPQTLITAGTAEGGKMMYYLTKGEESEVLPSATDAGTYNVYYYVKGDENHADYHHSADKDNAVKVEIAKAQVVVTPKEGQYKIFGDPDPEFEYTYTPTSPDVAVEPQFTGKLDRYIPDGDPIGIYAILQGDLRLTEESNKNFEYEYASTGFTSGVEFEVRQVSAELTKAPVVKNTLTYEGNGVYQPLLKTLGEAKGGEIWYQLSRDGKTFDPVNINPGADWAGDYTITYFIKGDENHSDVTNDEWVLHITIEKAAVTVTPDAGQTKEVGKDDPDPLTFSSDGWKASDPHVLEGKLAREDGETMGKYEIQIGSIKLGTDEVLQHNYDVKFVSGVMFEITPSQEEVEVVITGNQETHGYTGNEITMEKVFQLVNEPKGITESDITCSKTVSRTDKGTTEAELSTLDCKVSSASYPNAKLISQEGAKAVLTINAGTITEDDYTAPLAKSMPYDGSKQELIEPGSWNGVIKGVFQYKLSNYVEAKSPEYPTEFSTVIPVGDDAGTYTVEWKIVPLENYDGGEEQSGVLTSEITPIELTEDMIQIQKVVNYTGEEQQVEIQVYVNGNLVPETEYEIAEGSQISGTEPGVYSVTINGLSPNFTGSVDVTWEIKDMVNRISMFRIGEPDKVCLRCGVLGGELPATGFPTRVNVPLAVKPQGLDYAELGMRIQIPSLNVDVELAGVPTMDGAWKVEWLADRAGLLSGTALPGDGYSIVAAHNTLNAEEVGPFVLLSTLDENDTVFVNAPDGSMKLFRVYANELLAPNDMETLASIAEQESNTLVLVTCENESVDGGYLNRRVVFAKPLN